MIVTRQLLDIPPYSLLHLIQCLLAQPERAAQQLQDFMTAARA